MGQCLFRNELLACCGGGEPTIYYGSPWGAVAGHVKEKINQKIQMNQFHRFIAQPYSFSFISEVVIEVLNSEFCVVRTVHLAAAFVSSEGACTQMSATPQGCVWAVS